MRWYFVENFVTLVVMAAIILGAVYLGAGGWAWLGLLLLFNINYTPKAGP